MVRCSTVAIVMPEQSTRIAAVNDERELISRIRAGAVDEFARIVEQHKALVMMILHRYEHDAHHLEDLAQEAFVKVWKAIGQFDGRAPFAHWVAKITVRVALDHLRRRKRVQNQIGFDDLGEEALEWITTENEAAELNPCDARTILELGMRNLSAEEQMVLTLQELEGKSIAEISALTGWSNVATRVRAFRARKKLKKSLEQIEKERLKK